MSLTVRSCIPDSWFLFDGPTGRWQWGVMGRRQSAASVTDRVHWLLSGEKNPFWGHLPPVQKLSESLGLALPSNPPALRGLQDKLTQSHLSTHPGLYIPFTYLTKSESLLPEKVESASSVKIPSPVSFHKKLTTLLPRKTYATFWQNKGKMCLCVCVSLFF